MRSWKNVLLGLACGAVLACGCKNRTTMPRETNFGRDITAKKGEKGGNFTMPKPPPPPKWDPPPKD